MGTPDMAAWASMQCGFPQVCTDGGTCPGVLFRETRGRSTQAMGTSGQDQRPDSDLFPSASQPVLGMWGGCIVQPSKPPQDGSTLRGHPAWGPGDTRLREVQSQRHTGASDSGRVLGGRVGGGMALLISAQERWKPALIQDRMDPRPWGPPIGTHLASSLIVGDGSPQMTLREPGPRPHPKSMPVGSLP